MAGDTEITEVSNTEPISSVIYFLKPLPRDIMVNMATEPIMTPIMVKMVLLLLFQRFFQIISNKSVRRILRT